MIQMLQLIGEDSDPNLQLIGENSTTDDVLLEFRKRIKRFEERHNLYATGDCFSIIKLKIRLSLCVFARRA